MNLSPRPGAVNSRNFGTCLEHLGDDAGALEAHRTSLDYRENATTHARAVALARRLGAPSETIR